MGYKINLLLTQHEAEHTIRALELSGDAVLGYVASNMRRQLQQSLSAHANVTGQALLDLEIPTHAG